jgi:tRNA threonylcarbamoyl adenosine modification protein (Sua5/YciO/YrdC/YwlC family)
MDKKIISKKGFLKNQKKYIKKIKQGAVFIYPTDTIYGLGCNAQNKKAVNKIRKIKKRKNQPFSIIVPSKKWIEENCQIKRKDKKYLKKLPGKYTLILKSKNLSALAKNVSFSNSIGIRIPKSWFSNIVQELKIPIITTSVNIHSKSFMTCLEDLDKKIKNQVDFIIYEGKKQTRASTMINLARDKPKIIKR